MGGADKALLPLDGRPLLAHVADRFEPQVEGLALSANGDPARFSAFGLPVLTDAQGVRLGPMAGLLAGLDWLATTGGTHLATVSVDTPFLPCDLVPKLLLAGEATDGLAIAESQGRAHPTCGLWPLGLRKTSAGRAGRRRTPDRRLGQDAGCGAGRICRGQPRPVLQHQSARRSDFGRSLAELDACANPRRQSNVPVTRPSNMKARAVRVSAKSEMS